MAFAFSLFMFAVVTDPQLVAFEGFSFSACKPSITTYVALMPIVKLVAPVKSSNNQGGLFHVQCQLAERDKPRARFSSRSLKRS